MSYKSLLFCPDESSAHAVTQILTELEFAVEAANEPFGAVKKLSEERFDALVVDCQNEQDAALLFKTARDSAQNHSSLSVALVEGQAGVAKAFRIGANLVLTRPINIEQAKGTLRVARGLLRKNEAKPMAQPAPKQTAPVRAVSLPALATSAETRSVAALSLSPAVSASAPEPTKSFSAAPVTPQPEVPFSGLEVEADPTPAPEAAEIAVLESLPDLAGKPAPATSPTPHVDAQPVAASSSGQAAAVAPALEKAPVLGLNTASAAPMVTNEPIVAEKRYEDPLGPPAADVPSFASLEARTPGGSGAATKVFRFAVIFAAIIVAAYFGSQKLHPLQYLQRMHSSQQGTPEQVQSEPVPAPPEVSTPASGSAAPPSSVQSLPSPSSSPSLKLDELPPPPDNAVFDTGSVAPKNEKIETIEVKEMPMPGDPKPSVPKVEPLVVKPDTGTAGMHKPAPVVPPVQVSNLNTTAAALPNFANVEAELPKLAAGAVRVSQGVSQGLILKKVPPVYPPTALQLHEEGTVELVATISKQGAITNVQVLGGDRIFAKAAADAVRQWKYRPYLLNGEPVDIQTQITIVFKAPR